MLKTAAVRSLALIAILASTAVPGVQAHEAKPESATCTAVSRGEIARNLQAILDKATVAGKPHAALLSVQCGRQIWSLASGVADTATGQAAKPDNRFRAGSIMKPAISAVVLQLVEEGKLSLDDRITQHLPSRYTSKIKDVDAITVRMLLSHRSGLGEWTDATDLEQRGFFNPRKVWRPEDYIAISLELGPRFYPGTGYYYNNTEYVLLGLIIEQVTGTSWRSNVMRRVFKPLGISPRALPASGIAPDLRGHMHGYGNVRAREIDASDLDTSMADAAGGHAFAPTTQELVRLIDALLAGRLFKRPETLALMMDFGKTENDTAASGRRTGYGLGLGKYDFPDGVVGIGHTGGTAGYSSFVYRIPGLGIIIAGAHSIDDAEAITGFGAAVREYMVKTVQR